MAQYSGKSAKRRMRSPFLALGMEIGPADSPLNPSEQPLNRDERPLTDFRFANPK